MLLGFDRVGACLWPPVQRLKHTAGEVAAFCAGPAVWSVRAGCQPLCVCKASGSGSWMGARSLSVCILQSFSPGVCWVLSLLISGFNAIMPARLVSLAPSVLLTLQFWISSTHLLPVCTPSPPPHLRAGLSRTTERGYAKRKPKGLVTGLYSGQLKLRLVNN